MSTGGGKLLFGFLERKKSGKIGQIWKNKTYIFGDTTNACLRFFLYANF